MKLTKEQLLNAIEELFGDGTVDLSHNDHAVSLEVDSCGISLHYHEEIYSMGHHVDTEFHTVMTPWENLINQALERKCVSLS